MSDKVVAIKETTAFQALNDIEMVQKMTERLLKTPHYAKMGQEGIFAIVSKAKNMNVDVLDALNGGMYFVRGKVEMSGQLMLSLIRAHGHSITLDPKSAPEKVVMHGKRRDNGDTWTVSYSVAEARKSGTYKENGPWANFPQVMCQWRCVSMLGRFLFSDVIKGVFVEGETSSNDFSTQAMDSLDVVEVEQEPVILITGEQLQTIVDQIDGDEPLRERILKFLGISSLSDIQADHYEKVIQNIQKARA